MAHVALRSDAVAQGARTATVLSIKVSLAASGDLIAAPADPTQSIRVIGGCLVAAGAVTVKFQSGGSTDLTGAMSLVVGVPLSLGNGPWQRFQCAAGQKLNLVLGASVQVSGWLEYVLVAPT